MNNCLTKELHKLGTKVFHKTEGSYVNSPSKILAGRVQFAPESGSQYSPYLTQSDVDQTNQVLPVAFQQGFRFFFLFMVG